jgi:chorismate synthase
MSFGIGSEFRMTVFGESHGRCIGVVVEGCPPGLEIGVDDIQWELDRRKPGREATSSRKERDLVRIESGLTNNRTNGGPIMMMISNEDTDSSWYDRNRMVPRPSHADYTAFVKYGGFNDWRGGGFFSGRITAGMVMGGAIAKKLLSRRGVKIIAHLVQVGDVRAKGEIPDAELEAKARESPIWCADKEVSALMSEELEKAKSENDSLGGAVECRVLGLPVGVGEPIFDSVESVISHGIFSIPAVKGIEFGGGFGLSSKRGSEANDEFAIEGGRIVTQSNNSGGILGGITNGMPIVLRVAFKPTPSIGKKQRSVDISTMKKKEIRVEGRHDPCIAVRAVPVVEAMVATCLADLMIRVHKIGRVEGKI